MSYNQQYLVAAQMGHQQVQVQQHAVAEIAHQQVRRGFLSRQTVLVRFFNRKLFRLDSSVFRMPNFGPLIFPEKSSVLS